MKQKRNLLTKTAILVFSVFYFVSIIKLQLENNSMKEQVQILDSQISVYETYITELQATLDAPMDENYVSEIARDKLGLRHPQEVVFYSDDSD
ncbi:MAG: septum formation initiator family protein [Clostridia bacterium]|nr:septum formation initiator family protein [Clostridia bacterium]